MTNEKAKVFSRKDLDKVPASAPEAKFIEALDGTVYMKKLSGIDQDSYEFSIMKFVRNPDGTQQGEMQLEGHKFKYLVRCLCDEKGRRLYQDNEYKQLGSLDMKIINEMHKEALKINRATDEDLKEMEKNSETDLTEGSTSD